MKERNEQIQITEIGIVGVKGPRVSFYDGPGPVPIVRLHYVVVQSDAPKRVDRADTHVIYPASWSAPWDSFWSTWTGFEHSVIGMRSKNVKSRVSKRTFKACVFYNLGSTQKHAKALARAAKELELTEALIHTATNIPIFEFV